MQASNPYLQIPDSFRSTNIEDAKVWFYEHLTSRGSELSHRAAESLDDYKKAFIIIPSTEPITATDKLDQFDRNLDLGFSRLELARFLSNFSESQTNTLIVDDINARRHDKFLETEKKPFAYLDDRVVSFSTIVPGQEYSLTWELFNGIGYLLIDESELLHAGVEIDRQVIESILNSSIALIDVIYDDTTYIIMFK